MSLLGQTPDTTNRAITLSDLTGAGIISSNGGGVVPGSSVVADSSDPTAISGLTVTALFGGAFITWDAPTYTQGGGNAYTEIYAATGATATFASAVLVGTSTGISTAFADTAQQLGVVRCYWAKAVTNGGVRQATPTGGTNGVQITISQVATADIGTGQVTNQLIDRATANKLQIVDADIVSVNANKIVVSQLSALSADLGTVNSGFLNGVVITGGTIRTATSGQRVEINSDGITLSQGTPAAFYGDSTKKYGDSTNKYGSGVLAWINNSTKRIPFYVSTEQTVADLHMYNRSVDPTGAAEIGDLCVVNGKLKICTAAGTPGTWTIVGTQT